MDTFQIQMERAHQTAKAKAAAGEMVEALRVATAMTRALTDDMDGHPDLIEVDTIHIESQNLCAKIVRLNSGAGICGLPGGPSEFPPRAEA